ncbi:helix-turn-helix transcriptional regulator [Chryseobacterium sp. LAM-KRS1]|uniref:helix-turn-helix transcriptional regulator n=1 Tax=Chryseobacterium sp. LAM-KRS1 TaxID=2715754 RepID=UPI001555FC2B|nr:helix-turn-helix transcriptional regulator [Chryseobacterium sp. LAM-KRS1]
MIHDEDFEVTSIDLLKRELISRYVSVMLIVLAAYVFIFYFILKISLLAVCTLIYLGFALYSWLLIRKKYNIKTLVHGHLISAPLFAGFIMLYFWSYSMSVCIWLLPVPLGAYIFLEKKYVFLYSLYMVIIILSVNFIADLYPFDVINNENKPKLRISDIFVFMANIGVLALLLFYKDKIKKLEIEKKIRDKQRTQDEKDSLPNITVTEDNSPENVEKYTELFTKIKGIVEDEARFKESDFTVSSLCFVLKTNNMYISKAIKLNGYNTFNHYINTCRINHVKALIRDSDFNKVTLMEAYTASGFSNQSTFNRVFKQIEGITPSEYVKSVMATQA